MRSAANMPLILGSLEDYLKDPTKVASINIKIYPLQETQPFVEMLVHESCGSKVDYVELCPHCERVLAGPAVGGKNARPTKQTACNYPTCNKSLVGHKIVSEPYCNQDGCTCKLDETAMVKRVSSEMHGKKQLVALTDEEVVQLRGMRLSRPTDSRDAFKCMVVRGVRPVHANIPFNRIFNVRQIIGQKADDKQALWDLTKHISATGEHFLVHYAIRHVDEMTGEHEHTALLMADTNGKILLLCDLLDANEVRSIGSMPDDHEITDERVTLLRQAISQLPMIKDEHPDMLSTRFTTGLRSLFKAKVENKEWVPATFVDHDGMVRTAAGNLFFKLIRQGAVVPLDVETPPSK